MTTTETPHGESAVADWITQAKSEHLELVVRAAAQFYCLNRLYVGTAHDMKSHLNSIVMNLEVLKVSLTAAGDMSMAGKMSRYVQTLSQEVAHLDQRLHLLLTQISAPNDVSEPLNLVSLVENIAELVAPQAKQQRVRVEVNKHGAGLERAAVDANLREALSLLTVLALAELTEGGRILLSVEVQGSNARIGLSAAASGKTDPATSVIPVITSENFALVKEIAVPLATLLVQRLGGNLNREDSAADMDALRILIPCLQKG